MGKLGLVAALACAACNALTGADKLGVEPGTDDVDLRQRRPDETVDDAGTPTTDRNSLDASAGPSDASVDAATTNPVTFQDAFERTNGTTLGNGWLAKTANKFSLVDGAVKQAAYVDGDNYGNLIVRRPASESVRDVQIAYDFTYGGNADADPTLYARMQPSSDTTGVLTGYTMYVYMDSVGFTREDSTKFTGLQTNTISPPLVVGTKYRFTFRVHGTDPVTLEGVVANADGTVITSVATTDADPKRFVTAGQIGFGSSKGEKGLWDNFTRIDL